MDITRPAPSLEPGFDDAVRKLIEGAVPAGAPAGARASFSGARSRFRPAGGAPTRAVKRSRTLPTGLSIARPMVGISTGPAR